MGSAAVCGAASTGDGAAADCAAPVASDREVVKKALGLGWAEEFFVEDGLKLLGISCWLAYFALTGRGWVPDPP